MCSDSVAQPSAGARKPCEYCGTDLPLGVDKGTRRMRGFHYERCSERPVKAAPVRHDPDQMVDLLLRLEDAVEALDGTSVENERLVDDYRSWRASCTAG